MTSYLGYRHPAAIPGSLALTPAFIVALYTRPAPAAWGLSLVDRSRSLKGSPAR